ncbi:hypothetical protein [Rhodopila sp.]
MPSTPYTLWKCVARFRDQCGLLDAVIKLIVPAFDQSRLHNISAI